MATSAELLASLLAPTNNCNWSVITDALADLQTLATQVKSFMQVGTASYLNAVDPNLAGLQVEWLTSGNTHIFRGAGSLTATFGLDVNAWYCLIDTTTCPIIAEFQGTKTVVSGTWLSPAQMDSTVLWTPALVKYDATGLYVQLSQAPAGQYLAFEVVMLLAPEVAVTD